MNGADLARIFRALVAGAVQRPGNGGLTQNPNFALRTHFGLVSGAPDATNHTVSVKLNGESTARTDVWCLRDVTSGLSDGLAVLVLEVSPQLFVVIGRV